MQEAPCWEPILGLCAGFDLSAHCSAGERAAPKLPPADLALFSATHTLLVPVVSWPPEAIKDCGLGKEGPWHLKEFCWKWRLDLGMNSKNS